VFANANAPALFALGAPPPVFANVNAPALFALGAPPPVLADLAAAALLAPVAPPPVFADAAAATLLAPVAPPPVFADAAAATLLAQAALPPVRTRPGPAPFAHERVGLSVASHGRCARVIRRARVVVGQVAPAGVCCAGTLHRARHGRFRWAPRSSGKEVGG